MNYTWTYSNKRERARNNMCSQFIPANNANDTLVLNFSKPSNHLTKLQQTYQSTSIFFLWYNSFAWKIFCWILTFKLKQLPLTWHPLLVYQCSFQQYIHQTMHSEDNKIKITNEGCYVEAKPKITPQQNDFCQLPWASCHQYYQ